MRLEIGGGYYSIPILHDTKFNAARRFKGTVQDELRRVMQVVNNDVFARLESDAVGDYILTVARGEQEPDLVRRRVNQPGELCSNQVGRTDEPAHLQGAFTFRFDVRLARRDHCSVDRSNIGGVEIDSISSYRKVLAHAEWIVLLVGWRSGRLRRLSGRDEPAGRGSNKRTTGHRHLSYSLSRKGTPSCAEPSACRRTPA